MQSEIEGLDDYASKSEERNVIWILSTLQEVTSRIESKADVIFIEQEALLIIMKMRQGQSESNSKYLKHFKSNVITIKLSN